MAQNDRFKFYFATALLVFLVVFLLWTLKPFFNAFFGAFLIFFLFKNLNVKLQERFSWSKSMSASVIMVVATLVVLIPLFIGSSLLVGEVTEIISNPQPLIDGVGKVTSITQMYSIPVDLSNSINELVTKTSSMISNMLFNLAGNVIQVFLNLVIFYFTLFFLLVQKETFQESIRPYIPFSKKNSDKLVKKFKDITYATVVASGLIALFQGVFIGIGFWIFGLNSPIFWGFIALVVSFLPVLGVPIIWIPAALIQIFSYHRYGAGLGLIIWGVFSYISDSFLRPIIQKKVGEIHPLVTIVGVFIGLPLFGLLGLFIGPLLISYTLLIIQIYAEEYGDY
ncbi:AI-2E family transporter [Candidatus Woesearchaeota archaeon]|nr:AI-2E family transporter [Candidatus Woesearchaeota archaeon]